MILELHEKKNELYERINNAKKLINSIDNKNSSLYTKLLLNTTI